MPQLHSYYLFQIALSLYGNQTSGPLCSSITFFTFSNMSSKESPLTIAKKEKCMYKLKRNT